MIGTDTVFDISPAATVSLARLHVGHRLPRQRRLGVPDRPHRRRVGDGRAARIAQRQGTMYPTSRSGVRRVSSGGHYDAGPKRLAFMILLTVTDRKEAREYASRFAAGLSFEDRQSERAAGAHDR